MTRLRIVRAFVASLAAVLLSAAPAAADQVFLLGFEGISGDSPVELFPGNRAIDVVSFSWGVTNTSSLAVTGGSGAGKAAFSDFSVMLYTGSALPQLFLRTATGQQFPSARFIVSENTAEGFVERYEVEFKDVAITALQSSGAVGGEIAHNLSFSYAQVKLTIFVQQPDGTVARQSAGWSIEKNKALAPQ